MKQKWYIIVYMNDDANKIVDEHWLMMHVAETSVTEEAQTNVWTNLELFFSFCCPSLLSLFKSAWSLMAIYCWVFEQQRERWSATVFSSISSLFHLLYDNNNSNNIPQYVRVVPNFSFRLFAYMRIQSSHSRQCFSIASPLLFSPVSQQLAQHDITVAYIRARKIIP